MVADDDARETPMLQVIDVNGGSCWTRTNDQGIMSPRRKSNLLLNQSLAMLANFKTNVTQGTTNITRPHYVTITAQRCFAVYQTLAEHPI